MLDILIDFFIFLICVGIFHALLFTRWKTKNERFWKATDYWWLGVAVIGLWGVAERYEHQQQNQRMQEQDIILAQEYAAQHSWLVALINSQLQTALMAINSNIVSLEMGTKPDRAALFEAMRSLEAYTNLQMAMSNYRPYNKHGDELNSIVNKLKSSGQEGQKTAAAEAVLLFHRAIPEEDKLDRLRATVSGPLFGKVLGYLSPFLLAVALALRLTRVTAEVYVLRKT